MNEITREQLLCPCCHQGNPSTILLDALNQLQNTLGQPLSIHSGYRCPTHNAKVGGTPRSEHLTGRAADISSPAHRPLDLYLAADEIWVFRNGGIGLYNADYIHLDVRVSRARWFRVNEHDHPITDYLLHAHAA